MKLEFFQLELQTYKFREILNTLTLSLLFQISFLTSFISTFFVTVFDEIRIVKKLLFSRMREFE